MANTDIRRAAKASGVKLWQIAEAIGLADSGFSKKLRRELPDCEKHRIYEVIERLSREEAD